METLTAAYSGDTANQASTSNTLTLAGSGVRIATKLDWSPAATSTVFGTALPASALDAQVENGVAGTIAYLAQSGAGTSMPITAGAALPAAGAYSLTASFTPTNASDYLPSTASAAFTVTKAGVTEALTSSAAQAPAGTSVTLTDTVVSNTSGTPTGIVTFFAGTNSLGSATIGAGGVATINTASLPAGTSSITASYLGDGNFNSDTSAAISVVIGSPSIVFSLDQPAIAISAGSAGTETLTVMPQLGYTGNVAFACGNLPPGVSCSFSPANGAIGAGAFQSTLTVNTVAPSSAASPQNKPAIRLVGAAGIGLAAVFLIGMPGRRKRITWMAILLVAGSSAVFIGCGGGSSPTKTTTPTGPSATTLALSSSAVKSASGSYVTLTAALSGTNAASATGSVTFLDGTKQIGQANLANGSATLALNTLGVGIHTITASYAGDSLNSAPSTVTGVSQAITGQATFSVTAISGSISQSVNVNLTLQ
jgi:hypothetical protein